MTFRRRIYWGALALLLAVPAGISRADTTQTRADSLLADPPAAEFFAPWSAEISAAADSLADQGQLAEAARLHERLGVAAFRARQLPYAVAQWRLGLARARRGDDPANTGSLLNSLAIGLHASGDPEASLPFYAEAISLKHSLDDTLGLAKTWGNLANTYASLNRVGEAMAAADSAGRWNHLSGNVRGEVAVLGHRVSILNSLRRHVEALPLARRAVNLARTMDAEALGVSRRQLGTTLMDLGHLDLAMVQLDSALIDLSAAGDGYYQLYVRQDRIMALRGVDRLDEALAACEALLPDLNDAEQLPLMITVELQKGNILLDMGQPEAALRVLAHARRAFEQRLDSLTDEASRLGILPIAGFVYATEARALLAAGQIEAAWSAVEAGAGVLYRKRASAGAVHDLDEVQASLAAEGAVLIQAADSPQDSLLLFVVTADTLVAVTTSTLRPLVNDSRAALELMAAGQPDDVCAPPIARLAFHLVWPGERFLPADCRKIYLIVPHDLWGFPWDILPLRDGRLLGDVAPTAYLHNAGSLLELRNRQPVETLVVAVADPWAAATTLPGTGAVPDYRNAVAVLPLPEARREVAAIVSTDKELLMGRDATPAAVLAAIGNRPSVLHFATHALVHPLEPDASALVLADSANGSPRYLTAGDIADWDLATDLVVLSGCRTGQMGAALGEGPLGLPRAFLLAGSRAVVTSLWDVEDGAARIFMAAFYGAMSADSDPATALGVARRKLTAAGFPYRDRAAFVLSGWGGAPLPVLVEEPQSRWWLWFLGGIIGAGCAAWWFRSRQHLA